MDDSVYAEVERRMRMAQAQLSAYVDAKIAETYRLTPEELRRREIATLAELIRLRSPGDDFRL